MPRKPRIISSTGIYHVILRSINQHIIFEEDSDYQKFLFIMSDCKIKFDVDIYAYCLMDNHIHLLLHSTPDNLPVFFQSLGSRFVYWYNNKYLRYGHLFQDRYHSIPVEDTSYFLSVMAYIHNNPVRANLCKYPSEYRWSSYNAYLGQKNTLLDLSYSYDIAGSKDSLLHYFATHNENDSEQDFTGDFPQKNHFLTDDQALEIFKLETGLTTTSGTDNLPKSQRNEYIRLCRRKNFTQGQIARLMGVSEITVRRICKSL